MQPFTDLVDEIADIRRQAAANPRLTAYADVVKLLGNSLYGKTITNVDRFHTVRYVPKDAMRVELQSPMFVSCMRISRDIYEVTTKRDTISYRLPLLIGSQVCSLCSVLLLYLQTLFHV